MDRDAERDETIKEGHLTIEERMNRREGLVEYEGTVEGATTRGPGQGDVDRVLNDADTRDAGIGGAAMQAGATILGGVGTGATAGDATTGGGAPSGGTAAGSAEQSPSMSTDNTAGGAWAADTAEAGPMGQVREGMTVVDANGDEVGTVASFKMGDPAAMTTMGEETGDAGPFAVGGVAGGGATGGTGGSGSGMVGGGVFGAAPAAAGDEPRVDDPYRSELIRAGYIKVDAKGWFSGDRYVSAEHVAGVSGDTVRLSIAKDEMIKG